MIAHDAATESAQWTNAPAPFTFNHTPAGVPRGVLVLIAHSGDQPDRITGVTYGGVAMARTPNGFAHDAIAEFGGVYAYFLGAGIPAGTQQVAITYTDPTNPYIAYCLSVTAAADTELVIDAKLENDVANPAISLDAGAVDTQRYCILWSGLASEASAVDAGGGGQVAIAGEDFGPNVCKVSRQSVAAGAGPIAMGYTAAIDDVAMIAVAIKESAIVVAGRKNRVKAAGVFVDKPVLVKAAGVFVEKPVRAKVGGGF